MSFERQTIPASTIQNEISITDFFGGKGNGRQLQLTQTKRQGARSWDAGNIHGFIQVDRDQALQLAQELMAFAQGMESFKEVS